MKKILALIGSPRKLGNSEILVKEISRQIREPHQLKMLRLVDFNIQPCRGCYACLIKGRCVIKDDHRQIVEAIAEADALIVAAPTYFLGAHCTLKQFTDRGLCVLPEIEKIYNKPSLALGIAGIEGKEGAVMLGLENFLKMLLADIRGRCVIYGAMPGGIFLNSGNRKIARQMADSLFQPAAPPPSHACGVCGGETFRFLGKNRVRCMLCSNDGTVSMENGAPVINIQKVGHDMALNLEDTLKHRDWLIGMKTKFKFHKDQLKEICLDYRGDGDWIIPLGDKE